MTTTRFITGAPRGSGREWTVAAPERGDSVAATARDAATLHDLAESDGERVQPTSKDAHRKAG